MKEEQKVYIKGDPNRGAEVIKALTDLGGINCNNLKGISEKCCYYISPSGIIKDADYYDKAIMPLLKELYTEISIGRWKPKYGGQYYFIDIKGGILQKIWSDTQVDNLCYKFGNCFRTKEEAEAMAEKIKKLLHSES